MPAPCNKSPLLKDGEYIVKEVNELNFFDLMGTKGTKGTSAKSYHSELQVAKSGSKAQIFTMFGATGANQQRDWRYYDSESAAKKDYDAILKSKRKKGYKDIDVAQRALGSEDAKAITKTVVLKNADHLESKEIIKSKLDDGQKRLVEIFFGSQQQFISTTLKCPLGQLTNKQIDEGRARLNSAKDIVNLNSTSKSNENKILELTNEFYTLIPHNLGSGSRGKMDHLLLDSLDKIMQKEDDLDTLLDAKAVGAQLTEQSSLDAKYDTLNADISSIDSSDPIFKFIQSYFAESKVKNHGYASAKVKNVWSMHRKDKEFDFFNLNSERIANECGKHIFATETNKLSNGKSTYWTPSKRPDLDGKNSKLYDKANTWLCWHGTRSANLVGITTRGLLIRPSGAVHTGSAYGDGKYFAWQSTKSLNYTDGGYYTGGKQHNSSRFMFLLDVSFGNMHIAPHSKFYKSAPQGFHSVYGKANQSGVYNDEMITYDFNKQQTQSRIRYLLEIQD